MTSWIVRVKFQIRTLTNDHIYPMMDITCSFSSILNHVNVLARRMISVNRLCHIGWVAVLIQTDRHKPVRKRSVIEGFGCG